MNKFNEDKMGKVSAQFKERLNIMSQEEFDNMIERSERPGSMSVKDYFKLFDGKEVGKAPMQGWQCPLCKVVHSPLKGSCDCQNKSYKITC